MMGSYELMALRPYGEMLSSSYNPVARQELFEWNIVVINYITLVLIPEPYGSMLCFSYLALAETKQHLLFVGLFVYHRGL